MMDKDFMKLIDLIQSLFDLAMWQNARKAMQIKTEIDTILVALNKEFGLSKVSQPERSTK